jgi:D-alanyl-lipoteichoic acid acyltransferase DltB (MBOAT superfamily)
MVVRNTLIIFTVSGLWHGAAWHFVVWGLVCALFFIPLLLFGDRHKHKGPLAPGRALPSLPDLGKILLTFTLVCISWIFFRADTLPDAFTFFKGIFSESLFEIPPLMRPRSMKIFAMGAAIMVLFEWINRHRQHGLEMDGRLNKPLRMAIYYALIALLVLYAPSDGGDFIYFQF